MKKITRLTVVAVCIATIAIGAVGCYQRDGANTTQQNNNRTDNNQMVEPNTENTSAQINPATTTGQDNTIAQNASITEERAKEIALEKAGLTADQVVFDRVEFDRDYGRDHYEVEFRQDRTEYSADIDAKDGTILDWEVDYDD